MNTGFSSILGWLVSYNINCHETVILYLRTAFTVAVVGSAVVAKRQINQRREHQTRQGLRPTEKLSWEERVALIEQGSNEAIDRTRIK